MMRRSFEGKRGDTRAPTPEERLARLGYELPPTPTPSGLYTGAVRHGSIVYLSGHSPGDAGRHRRTGVLGADLSEDEAKEAVREASLACLATLRSEIGRLDAVDRFLKVLGMLRTTADFGNHPAIMDSCTALLQEIFGERGGHARSAVGMASLPFGTVVEIEMIVAVDPTRSGGHH